MNAESSESMARGLPEAGGALTGSHRPKLGVETGAASRGKALVWAGLTLAFILFLAVGSVTTHDGRGTPERSRIARIWSSKADTLPNVGNAGLLRFSFFGAVALFIVASIAGLGIMLELPTAPEPAKPERSSAPTPADNVKAASAPGPAEG